MAALPPLIPLPAGSSFDGRVLTVAGLDLADYDYELVLVDGAGAEITPLTSTVGLGVDNTSATPGGPVGFDDLTGQPSDNPALEAEFQHFAVVDTMLDLRLDALERQPLPALIARDLSQNPVYGGTDMAAALAAIENTSPGIYGTVFCFLSTGLHADATLSIGTRVMGLDFDLTMNGHTLSHREGNRIFDLTMEGGTTNCVGQGVSGPSTAFIGGWSLNMQHRAAPGATVRMINREFHTDSATAIVYGGGGTFILSGITPDPLPAQIEAGTTVVRDSTTGSGGAKSELEVLPNYASFPATGLPDTTYVAADTGNQYIWAGTAYAKLSDSGLSANVRAAIANANGPSAQNPFVTGYDLEGYAAAFGVYSVFTNAGGNLALDDSSLGSVINYALASDLVITLALPNPKTGGQAIYIRNSPSSVTGKTITLIGRPINSNANGTLVVLQPGDSAELTAMRRSSGVDPGYLVSSVTRAAPTSAATSLALCQVAYNTPANPISVNAGMFVPLPFDTVEIDTASGWQAGANKFVVPAGQAGIYEVAFKARLSDGFPAGRGFGLGVDKVAQDSSRFAWQQSYNVTDGTSRNGAQTGQILYQLAEGDSLIAFCYGSSPLSFVLTNLIIKRVR